MNKRDQVNHEGGVTRRAVLKGGALGLMGLACGKNQEPEKPYTRNEEPYSESNDYANSAEKKIYNTLYDATEAWINDESIDFSINKSDSFNYKIVYKITLQYYIRDSYSGSDKPDSVPLTIEILYGTGRSTDEQIESQLKDYQAKLNYVKEAKR